MGANPNSSEMAVVPDDNPKTPNTLSDMLPALQLNRSGRLEDRLG